MSFIFKITALICVFVVSFAVPDSPRGLSVNVQNQSYVVLQWNPPEHTSGVITDYHVTAQRMSAPRTRITRQTNDSSTEIRLHQLDTTAMYRFSVLAVNRIGKGPPVVVPFDLSAGWYSCDTYNNW